MLLWGNFGEQKETFAPDGQVQFEGDLNRWLVAMGDPGFHLARRQPSSSPSAHRSPARAASAPPSTRPTARPTARPTCGHCQAHAPALRTWAPAGAGIALALMLLWLGLWAWGAWAQRFPLWWLGATAALNLLTFFTYALDKSAAQRGTWRTRESHLHLLALLGGWPAAWWASGGCGTNRANRTSARCIGARWC